MKTIFRTLTAALLLACTAAVAQNSKPFTIPEVKTWKAGNGTLTLTPQSRIVCTAGDAAYKQVASQLADDYALISGTRLSVVTDGKGRDGDIVLRSGGNRKQAESYRMAVGRNVTITAPTATGALWATRTLLQLLDQSPDLPQGTIDDCPDFEMRGFMLDCGRKYIPMDYLRQLVRVMSYYKMNTLQIHLNDVGFSRFYDSWDETYTAFRLECETYPGLTARDGYYTKKEFIDFQEMAARYGVEIIPEIDAPAHSLAFTRYDSTLCSTEFGPDHLDLRNPKVFPFLENLWKEYLEGDRPVFRGPRVDIGTDEYSNKDSLINETFRRLTDHLIRYVEGYGKQAVLWGSLTHAKGHTAVKSDNVIMALWYNGYADPLEMKKHNFKFISIPDRWVYIVPRAGYYHDYLDIKMLYNEWTPNRVADVTLDYDDPSLLGGMFAVWNDHVGNGISTKDIHHRLFPAMQTLSAKFWTGKGVSVPFDRFNALRQQMKEAPGVNELGRLGQPHSQVLALAELKAGATTGVDEIGYDYTVSFDLENRGDELPGTALLTSPNATFWLADPVTGRFGFSRDDYLTSFNFRPYAGEKVAVTIKGNNTETLLYINGKLEERKAGKIRLSNDKKFKMHTTETLFFPLQRAGAFKSRVTNFKVFNFIDK